MGTQSPSTKRTMPETFRAVADLIEAHPEIPLPYVSVYDHSPDRADLHWYLHINARAADAEDQRAKAAAIVKAIGGKWRKDFDSDEASFRQQRDGFNMGVVVVREAVCERVVVGEETVTIPAVEAQPERTTTREIVEWRCEPMLSEAAR